jgi:glycosyltransferase involved in cell wall biosynthesis
MKILWFTWKDMHHPLAGGAEIVNHELAKRLAADGHTVHFIVGGFKGAERIENIDGYRVTRMSGGRLMAYFHAYHYYQKNLKGTADLIIDEINTLPFMCKWYVKEKNILFIHQLARQIWFYEMGFPFNVIGYLLEPWYLRMLNDRVVVTVSESTKADLMKFGFKNDRVHIISEGIEIAPVASLKQVKKFNSPTLLSLGSIRSMKRTDQIITAFEIAKQTVPDLQLIVAGKIVGNYGNFVAHRIHESRFRDSINYLGPVSKEEKIELLQRSHVLAVTSLKEGWCLVVTEANSQGTPAVAYNVDGLRDSVKNGVTGIVVDPIAQNMAFGITTLIQDPALYATMQKNAWEWSKSINFDTSYAEFKEILDHA